MRKALFPPFLAASLIGGLAWAAADPTRSSAGFVFVAPTDGKAELRESPDPASKVVGVGLPGSRLVFRSVAVGLDNKTSWYRVEVPGASSGWLAASEASDKRPVLPPPARPIIKLESGLKSGNIKAGPTAAARGLDERARKYGAAQDLGDSADDFVTLEKFVEKMFADEHEKDGTYPETGDALKPRAAARAAKAKEFKRGIQ